MPQGRLGRQAVLIMDRMKKEWKTSLQRGDVIGLHACRAVTNYACVSMASLRKPDDLTALASVTTMFSCV